MERFLYNLRESQKLFRHRLQLLDDHLKNNKFFNTFMKHLSKIAAMHCKYLGRYVSTYVYTGCN